MKRIKNKMISLKFFLQKRKKTIKEFINEFSIKNLIELQSKLDEFNLLYDLDYVKDILFIEENKIEELDNKNETLNIKVDPIESIVEEIKLKKKTAKNKLETN